MSQSLEERIDAEKEWTFREVLGLSTEFGIKPRMVVTMLLSQGKHYVDGARNAGTAVGLGPIRRDHRAETGAIRRRTPRSASSAAGATSPASRRPAGCGRRSRARYWALNPRVRSVRSLARRTPHFSRCEVIRSILMHLRARAPPKGISRQAPLPANTSHHS